MAANWIQKFTTFKDMLEYGRQNYPKNIVMADPVKKRFVRYNELTGAVYGFADYINALVDTDERFAVSIYGENSMEWMLVFLSVVTGNNIVAPINNQIKEKSEIRRLIEMAGIRVVFVAKQFAGLFESVVGEWPGDSACAAPLIVELESACAPWFEKMETPLVPGADAKLQDSTVQPASGSEPPATGGANNPRASKKAAGPDDYAILLYTSGSIRSKGVMHSQRSLLSNQQSAAELLLVAHQEEVFIAGLPLSHAYGLLCGFVPLSFGSIAAYAPTPRAIADYITASSKTFPDKKLLTAGVPELARIMNQRIIRSARGSRGKNAKPLKIAAAKARYATFLAMRHINYYASTCFGFDLSGVFFKAIKERFGSELKMPIGGGPIDKITEFGLRGVGILAISGYGTTEMAPLVAANVPRFKDVLSGTVGHTPGGTEVTLIDDEVCSRGPNTMLGYLGDEEATKKAMPGDGWYHTGDKGYFVNRSFFGKHKSMENAPGRIYGNGDDKCFLALKGRVDNQFANHRGENIFPEVIELLLMNYPAVNSCRVFESPPSCVMAQIFPDAEAIEEKIGKKPDADEIRSQISQIVRQVNLQLQSGCQIDDFEIKDADFDRNAFGKIKRR